MAEGNDTSTARSRVPDDSSGAAIWRNVVHAMWWLPGIIAVIFMATTGIIMIITVNETRMITQTNLYQTCENAERIRPAPEAEECWEAYTHATGKRAHQQ